MNAVVSVVLRQRLAQRNGVSHIDVDVFLGIDKRKKESRRGIRHRLQKPGRAATPSKPSCPVLPTDGPPGLRLVGVICVEAGKG